MDRGLDWRSHGFRRRQDRETTISPLPSCSYPLSLKHPVVITYTHLYNRVTEGELLAPTNRGLRFQKPLVSPRRQGAGCMTTQSHSTINTWLFCEPVHCFYIQLIACSFCKIPHTAYILCGSLPVILVTFFIIFLPVKCYFI